MSLFYRSYADMSALISKKIDVMTIHEFDLIVGIPRSGMIPAYMIALYLNINCCSFPDLRENQMIEKCGSRTIIDVVKYPQNARKILIIDDSYGSGQKLKEMVESLPSTVRSKSIVGAIYSAQETIPMDSVLSFYLEYIPKPRLFEWNIYHHDLVRKSAFDIDGVLCFDPEEIENDDGEAYVHFLRNARAKFIPTLLIHTLVTSRLEKYRAETELWLKAHRVIYSNLIMLDLPSQTERRKQNIYASHKADAYKNDELILFFESSSKFAEEIFNLSGKPVFCIENNTLYR